MEIEKRQIRIPSFSVVIPTYGEKGIALTEQCLASIDLFHKHIAHEVIVVLDGGADDESLSERYKFMCQAYNVTLLATERGGFTKACNVGIANSNGSVVFLCNNDVKFFEPTLQALCEAQGRLRQTMGCGVIAPRLLYADNRVQHGGVLYIKDPNGGNGWWDHAGRGAFPFDPAVYTMRPSLVTGALMGISRECIDRVGLLDERMHTTCSDIDYCLKAIDAGLPPVYFGFVAAYHLEGQTRGATPEEKAQLAPDIAVRENKDLAFLFSKWIDVRWQETFGA